MQKKIHTGLILFLLFGIGHCVTIAVAGSSAAMAIKLLDNSAWQRGGFFPQARRWHDRTYGNVFHRSATHRDSIEVTMFSKAIIQSTYILLLSAVMGLGVNAIRSDGLPLVHAEESAVQLDISSGEISIKDAAMLFISKRAVFLDARSQMEYDEGHIQGAFSAPVEDFEYLIEEIEPKLRGRETIITYCDGERCHLSHELAKLLQARGFDNVYVLKNGWTLWQTEKLPVAIGTARDASSSTQQPECTEHAS